MRHFAEIAAAAITGAAAGAIVGAAMLGRVYQRIRQAAQLERESISAHARDWENRLRIAGQALRKGK